MFNIDKNVCFTINNDFIVDKLLSKLYGRGVTAGEIERYDPSTNLNLFIENVFSAPLLGSYRVAILNLPDATNEFFGKILDTVPETTILIFVFDRIPGRITKRMKTSITFRNRLNSDELSNLLSDYLIILGKKVSASTRNFLLVKMSTDLSKTFSILKKIANLTPHLFLDEKSIKKSFELTLSKYEVPEAFYKSKGLDCLIILNQVEFRVFRTLYRNFLFNLIQFKIAENRSTSEKFKIIKAHPDVIRKFEKMAKLTSLPELEARFVYFNFISGFSKEIFIIKHLAFNMK